MYQFVETICIKNGEARGLRYHVDRMNKTIRQFFPGMSAVTEKDFFCDIPQNEGLQKARIVYGENGITEHTFAPYHMRDIQTIAIVEDNDIEYSWKSTDRSMLVSLREEAPMHDEVIIVKNGNITDTSYTNLCFYDGSEWVTPDTPLLPGTMRQRLLDQGLIKEERIRVADLCKYQKVCLINAMMELGDLVVPIDNVELLPNKRCSFSE